VLACACDVRYMSGGTIGLTELLVGVPFPPVPLEISRHVLGTATTSMVVNGRTLTPGEALTIGLVDEVVGTEDLLDVAVHRAHELTKVPADVYALTKEQLHRPVHELLERSHPLDDARVLEHWQSESTREAMTHYLAGLAKRP
jgi:enoyl-CoA hydratase